MTTRELDEGEEEEEEKEEEEEEEDKKGGFYIAQSVALCEIGMFKKRSAGAPRSKKAASLLGQVGALDDLHCLLWQQHHKQQQRNND